MQKIFFQKFIRTVVPYYRAKFCPDTGKNGGFIHFFEICMAPYGSDIYKDCPKNTTSGVGINNSSTGDTYSGH